MADVVSPPTERVGEGIQHLKKGCLSPHRIHAGVVIDGSATGRHSSAVTLYSVNICKHTCCW